MDAADSSGAPHHLARLIECAMTRSEVHLCVGTIEKRPRVITTSDGEDVIAIRQMAYFAMTYDHRVVDGADAEKFLSYLKHYLENTDFVL